MVMGRKQKGSLFEISKISIIESEIKLIIKEFFNKTHKHKRMNSTNITKVGGSGRKHFSYYMKENVKAAGD